MTRVAPRPYRVADEPLSQQQHNEKRVSSTPCWPFPSPTITLHVTWLDDQLITPQQGLGRGERTRERREDYCAIALKVLPCQPNPQQTYKTSVTQALVWALVQATTVRACMQAGIPTPRSMMQVKTREIQRETRGDLS